MEHMSSQPSPMPVPRSAAPLWRRATRVSSDRQVAGVCTGIARHLDLDPLLIRVLAVVLALSDGVGVVAYAAAWVLMPDESGTSLADRHIPGLSRRRPRTVVLVAVAICLATLPLWKSVTPFGLAPIVVLAAAWWISRRAARRAGEPGASQSTAHPAADAPQTPAAASPASPAPQHRDASPAPFDPYRTEQAHLAPRPAATPRARRRRTWWLTPAMLAGAVAAAAIGYRLDAPRPVLLGLAAALGVVALFELVGTVWRRPRLGVPLGIVLALCLVGVVVVPPDVPRDAVVGSSASTAWRSAGDIPAHGITVAGGDARVDADRLDLTSNAEATIVVMGGDLTLVAPRDATIVVAADLHQGDLRTPDGHDARTDGTAVWKHGSATSPTLTVHLRVYGGSARVVSPR